MFVTKNELADLNVKEVLENERFIKITDGRHTITKIDNERGTKIVVTEHFGLSVLPSNKIPKYIKRKLA